MPNRKKHKNKAGSDISGLEENVSVSSAAFESGSEAGEVPYPFPGNLGAIVWFQNL